jgi:serine/threonine protein phosphatase PrpC
MTQAVPRFLSAASSDQGLVRGNNEDRILNDDARGLFAVIDGMGGHAAGETAAQLALDRIQARLERQTGPVEQRIREAVALANNAIYEAAQTRAEWNGMACVLTIAVIENGLVTIGHVGDSRLYRIERGKITKVTPDHSPVGEREDSGELTEAEAMQHPRRNEVYRDVGSQPHAPDDDEFIEILTLPFDAESALLLCSDGLSDVLPSKEILRVIEENVGDRWAAVRGLIEAANQNSKDNVSAILIEGERFAGSIGKKQVSTTVIASSAPARPQWYVSCLLMLLCSVVLGAVVAYFASQFFSPTPAAPAPAILTVAQQGGQFIAIAPALAAAKAGDTVEVGPGVYRESIALKNGVALVSRQPRAAIIEGSVTAQGIQSARFEGFLVRGAETGVVIRDSDVSILRNEIANARGAGVEFDGNSRGAVVACTIHDNEGPGVLVRDAASPAIENNVIVGNGVRSRPLKPGIQVESTGRPRIVANIFLSNGAEAMWLPERDDLAIQRNYFSVSGKVDERSKARIIIPTEVRR